MGVYVHDRNWGSRRSIAFVAIIIFHVILIYGLKSGFAQKVMESIAPPIVNALPPRRFARDDAPNALATLRKQMLGRVEHAIVGRVVFDYLKLRLSRAEPEVFRDYLLRSHLRPAMHNIPLVRERVLAESAPQFIVRLLTMQKKRV